MEQYKTVEIIEKYKNLIDMTEPTEEEKFFVYNYALMLAESLMFDLGDETAKKLGKILLAISE